MTDPAKQNQPQNKKALKDSSGATLLLSELRSIMASSIHAEDKLSEICKLTATQFDVEVCSIYLMRSNDELELFATHGLNPDAVHKTHLKTGEGIVGYVAQHGTPLNIANASKNPNFAPRPLTGEEPYDSFCAVPIVREQKICGILSIQSSRDEALAQQRVELLQTVAMVLAEFVASGDIISRHELALISKPMRKPTQLHGQTFSPGLVISQAFVHRPQPTVKNVIADDPAVEKARFQKAIDHLDDKINSLIGKTHDAMDTGIREMLESYRMFAQDKPWQDKIINMIDEGLTADAAVQRAQSETRSRFESLDTPILREKIHDINDISNRLIFALNDQNDNQDSRPDKFILVAKSLSPAALFEYGLDNIQAIVLSGGSRSGHIAIIARSVGIPLLGQCRDAFRYIRNGDQLIVDSDNGLLYLNPSDYVQDLYEGRLNQAKQQARRYQKNREKPARTLDGTDISLQMNAALLGEMPLLSDSSADGIGLFRTEISFMGRSRYPRVADQARFYSAVLDQAKGKTVTFRTVDIGGDKPLPYFKSPDEENPALGWRAMRIIMDRPAVLRTQTRALIRGANGRPLRMMLPFVSDVNELLQAKKLIKMEFDQAEKMGAPLPETFELGIMIEVPSIVWQLEEVFQHIDFAAIGTNDLKQYLFASDYRSDVLKDRYDVLSIAMLRVLRQIKTAADAADRPVSICGEMASRPIEAMALIALGFDTLSMPITAMGSVKDMIRSMHQGELTRYVDYLLRSGSGNIRKKLESYARDHNIRV